jgi:TolB-like protein
MEESAVKRILQYLSLVLFGLLVWTGCATTPFPDGTDDSLLVVLTTGQAGIPPARLRLQGPLDVTLDLPFTGDTVRLARLLPGEYAVGLSGSDASLPDTLTVEPGTITLFPLSFFSDGKETATRPVTAAEQTRAARLLLDHIGVQNWFDRRYAGFGNARPKMFLTGKLFALSIVTDPPGAAISIDNASWGNSPQKLELAAGKYLLQVEKPGYTGVRRYISVSSEHEEVIQLEKAKGAVKPVARDRFALMVYPFLNMDDPAFNPYGTVFQGSIKANFSANRRYQLIDDAGAKASSANYPDLDPAEKAGAELVIAGTYRDKNNEIFVHAVLYDVKSHRVKFADTYTGESGFAVFSSIDEMSRDFSLAADKNLPEPGQPVIEEEGDPGNVLISFEKELFREQVIEDYTRSPVVLGFSLGMSGVIDPVQGATTSFTRAAPLSPINSLDASLEFIISPEVSYYNSLSFHLERLQNDTEVTFSTFLNTGPRLNFRNEKSDISVALLATVGFSPHFTFDDGGTPLGVGPFIYAGAKLGIGYRYYFHNRLSELVNFLNLSLMMDLAVFRFDISGATGPVFVPLCLGLYAGWGFAL